MKFRIDEKGGSIDVQIEPTDSDNTELLEAFQRCREGRCDCPTNEYEKLKDLRISTGERGISLHLEAKPGQFVSQKAVAKCLEHTLRGRKKED